jgi:hypothetical protein
MSQRILLNQATPEAWLTLLQNHAAALALEWLDLIVDQAELSPHGSTGLPHSTRRWHCYRTPRMKKRQKPARYWYAFRSMSPTRNY